jgi:hypothetical protein
VPKMVQDSKPVGVSEFKKKTELKLGRLGLPKMVRHSKR